MPISNLIKAIVGAFIIAVCVSACKDNANDAASANSTSQTSGASSQSGAVSTSTANNANLALNSVQNSQDLSQYRQMYAKPINEWSKPTIDASVSEWEEFAPIPRTAPAPKDNEFVHTKAHLGRNLFNDPRLSKSGQFACESCHHKEIASSDALPRAIGHDLQVGRRNTPSSQMAGFFDELFWDGRAKSLEEQALGPITDPVEMANTLENAENAIKNAPEYYPLFVAAFGDDEMKKVWAQWYEWMLPKSEKEEQAAKKAIHTHKPPENNASAPKKDDFLGIEKLGAMSAKMLDELKEQERNIFASWAFKRLLSEQKVATPKDDILAKIPQAEKEKAKKLITIENIAKAIATFERGPGLMSARGTRFNRFLQGEYELLSDKELWGLDIFRNKGGCMNCHYGFLLSDKKFHNIGLDFYGRAGQDLGRYEVTKNPADVGAFKTPSLVNVSKTAPYMHNGIAPNLAGVIQLFNEGVPVPAAKGVENDALKPSKSPLIKPLNLSVEEIEALEAFLRAL